MVVTHLNARIPEGLSTLHPLLERAFEEMARLSRENAPDGKYVIEGDELFINVISFETKTAADSLFETHKDYIDIQMMMEGEEWIGFAPKSELTVTKPYAPDCELYSMPEIYDRVRIKADKLCIIFPDEPHAPGIAVNDATGRVKKMVVKIKMSV